MKIIILSLILMLSLNAHAVFSSNYTDIKVSKCVIISSSEIEPDAEIDYLKAECPSFGGYRVQISGGDIRYSLDLSYEGTNIPMVKLSAFHDLASEKVEWRYNRYKTTIGFKVDYTALIYRLKRAVSDTQDREMLIVVRLDKQKSCVIGIVDQQVDMNKKAQKIADSKNAKCIDVDKVY